MTTTTRPDYRTISLIADKAIKNNLNLHDDKLSLMMDIEYTNEVIPLDLEALLSTDDSNFAHDIIGIQQNFNRTTKQMDNCFLPRFAI